MNKKDLRDIIFRYSILLLIFIVGGGIFYFLFQGATVLSSYSLLKIIYPALELDKTNIYLASKTINIIGACVASSAYLLLLFLNLTTPNIKLKNRLIMIISSFGLLFVINVLRIFYLGILFLEDASYFDIAHKIFWYAGSTIFVVAIWIGETKIFKANAIPIYSDLKKIYKRIIQ